MGNKIHAMEDKEYMGTLVSCLNDLQTKGYKTQFKAAPEGLISLTTNKVFQPENIKIAHFFRFEGESNPSDSSIVYAIESSGGEKGTLVDGYGNASDEHISHFMEKVKN